MKKIIAPSAAAILFAAASVASAQMFYEPFDYGSNSVGTNLSNTTGTPNFTGYTDPMANVTWVDRGTSLGGEITVNSGNVFPAGLAASAGNLATLTGGTGQAKVSTISIGNSAVTSGTIYYSLAFTVADLTNLTSGAGGAFFASFNNTFQPTTTTAAPTTFMSRLVLKRDGTDTTKFDIGMASNSGAATPSFAAGSFSPNTPIFVVGSYTYGVSTDTNSLWVNPTSLGTATVPSPDVSVTETASKTVGSFILRENASQAASIKVDDVRFDTSWAQVTPPTGSVYTAGTSTDWSNSGAWDAGGVPSGSQKFAYFTGAGGTVHVDSPQTVGTITLRSANSYSIGGTSPSALTFNGGSGGASAINLQPQTDATSGAVLTGAHTFTSPIILATDLAIHTGTNQTLTLSGNISGTGSILKDSPGNLSITGNNTLAGSLSASQGAFSLTGNNSFAGSLSLNTVSLTLGGTNTFAGNISLTTVGTVDLATAGITYAGTTAIAGATTLRVPSDSSLGVAPTSPTVNVIVSKNGVGTTTLLFTGNTTLNANRTIEIAQSGGGGPDISVNGGNSVTFLGNITGGSGGTNFRKNGSGTLYLRGDNTTNVGGGFMNAFFILAGTVNVNADNNLGTGAAQINSGGTLQFGASFPWPSRKITITGGNTAATIDTNGFDETIAGNIVGTTPLLKAGLGTLALNNATNTFSGRTIVNGGLLDFVTASSYGSTSNITANFRGAVGLEISSLDPTFLAKINASDTASVGGLALATVDAAANVDFTTSPLNGTGTVGMSVGAIGAVNFTGSINPAPAGYRLGGGGTLTVANANTLTGANAVTVTNGGTVVLPAANNYSGLTTVQGGTILSVGASTSLGNNSGTNNLALDTGGILQASNSFSTTRSLTVNTGGGTIDTQTNIVTIAGGISGTDTLTKAGGGTLEVASLKPAGLNVTAGTVKITQGVTDPSTAVVLTSVPTFGATGRLDLTNNKMVINYAGTAPINAVRAALLNGRGKSDGFNNDETWNGTTGIISSTAGGGGTFSIGYADNSNLPFGSYTSFGGQSVGSSSILIKYTLSGDTNLNGIVDDIDVQAVANNYQQGVGGVFSLWSFGDMDYNNAVDDNDVQAIINNYDPNAVPLSAAQLTAQYGTAFGNAVANAQAAHAAAVPEPASLSILGIGSLALLKRKRKLGRFL